MHVLGVVLAGGRSTRMGRDKALLQWRGRPLIEHQIGLLESAGVDAVVVSGDRPAYGGIPDEWAGCGPIAGLATIATRHPGDHDLLVIPVDMPLVRVETLTGLLRLQPRAGCLRPAGAVLPMRLRLDSRTRAVLVGLAGRAEHSQRSLRVLQATLGCGVMPVDDVSTAEFSDCNTLIEWEKCNESAAAGSKDTSARHAR